MWWDLATPHWPGFGPAVEAFKDLNNLIPKNSGWYLWAAWGINDAGKIIGYGTPASGGPTHAFLLTPTSAPAVAATASAASLTDATSTRLEPVAAAVQSTLPLTVAPPSTPGLQGSSNLIPLAPPTDQDLNLVASELIHSGKKRPRPSFS